MILLTCLVIYYILWFLSFPPPNFKTEDLLLSTTPLFSPYMPFPQSCAR